MRSYSSTKPLSARDAELLKAVTDWVKALMKLEKAKTINVAALSKASYEAVFAVRTGKKNYHILSLLRVLDAMGYEIGPVKCRDAKTLKDDPEAAMKVHKFKTYNRNAQRRKRGQPEGTRVQTRKIKQPGHYLEVHSRRDIVNRERGKEDFLAD